MALLVSELSPPAALEAASDSERVINENAAKLSQALAAGRDDCVFKPDDLEVQETILASWLPRGDIAENPVDCSGATNPFQKEEVPFDLSVFSHTWRIDGPTLPEVLRLIQQTNEEDAQMLREGITAKDFAKVDRASNRLLAASKMLGAHDLTGAIVAMEHAAWRDNVADPSAAMDEFEQEFANLRAYINSAGAATTEAVQERALQWPGGSGLTA